MANVIPFFTYMKRLISAQGWFATRGFTNKAIYRAYLPQVKDPVFPCITLVFDPEKLELFANISEGKLYIGVHSKSFGDVEAMANDIDTLLHLHKGVDGNLTVYKCHNKGGTPQPMHNATLNYWETVLEFDVSFG